MRIHSTAQSANAEMIAFLWLSYGQSSLFVFALPPMRPRQFSSSTTPITTAMSTNVTALPPVTLPKAPE